MKISKSCHKMTTTVVIFTNKDGRQWLSISDSSFFPIWSAITMCLIFRCFIISSWPTNILMSRTVLTYAYKISGSSWFAIFLKYHMWSSHKKRFRQSCQVFLELFQIQAKFCHRSYSVLLGQKFEEALSQE